MREVKKSHHKTSQQTLLNADKIAPTKDMGLTTVAETRSANIRISVTLVHLFEHLACSTNPFGRGFTTFTALL